MQLLFIVGGAAILVAIYFVGRLLRSGEAWMNNTEKPKERVMAYVVLAAAIGGLAGYLAYPYFACMQLGKGIVSCLIR